MTAFTKSQVTTGAGAQIQTVEVNDGTTAVERQVIVLADSDVNAALAKVTNAAPGSSDYGVVTRIAGSIAAITPDPTSVIGSISVADAAGPAPTPGVLNTTTPTTGSVFGAATRGGDASCTISVGTVAGGTALSGFYYIEQSMDATTDYNGTWVVVNAHQLSLTNEDQTTNLGSVGIVRFNLAGARRVRVRNKLNSGGNASVQIDFSAAPYGAPPGALVMGANLGTVIVGSNAILSSNNTTSTILGSAITFTGSADFVQDYSTITVSVATDQASAVDGLQLQQSMNGVNWDFVDAYTLVAGATKTFSIPVQASNFRVVLLNGPVQQGFLRLQTIYHKSAKRGSSVRPQDARDNQNDMEENLCYNNLYNATTGAWDRQRGSIAFGALADPSRNAPDTTASGSLTTQNLVPAGAATASSAVQIASGTGINTVSVQVTTQTTTGAISAQVSNNGTTWLTMAGNVFWNPVTGAFSATIPQATTGIWQVAVGAFAFFRVTTLASTTGSGAVLLEASTAAAGLAITNTVPVTVTSGTITAITNTVNVVDKPATSGGTLTKAVLSAAAVFTDFAKNAAGQLYGGQFSNSGAGWAFVKLYNKASAPVLASDVPVMRLAIPPGGARELSRPLGVQFTTGIAIAVTGAFADTDTTALTAGQVIGSLDYF